VIALILALAPVPTAAAMEDARHAWRQCAYHYVELTYRVPDSSDLIADAAIADCEDKERTYEMRYVQHFSTFQPRDVAEREAKEFVAELRKRLRKDLIIDVQLARAAH
jgi:hypothetical protein